MRARDLVVLVLLAMASAGCAEDVPARAQQIDPPRDAAPLHARLLLHSLATSVVVEIDYIEGRAPHPDTLRAIERALHAVAGKTEVRLLGPEPIDAIEGDVATERSPAQSEAIGRAVETARPRQDDVAYLHLLFLDGRGRDERGTFRGVQIGETLVVHPDTLKPSAMLAHEDGPRFPHHARLETQVALHELGHAFGLVDCGLPMKEARADEQSACHSIRETSVMRAYVDLIDMTRDLAAEGSAVPSWYDEGDLADIAAFQAE